MPASFVVEIRQCHFRESVNCEMVFHFPRFTSSAYCERWAPHAFFAVVRFGAVFTAEHSNDTRKEPPHISLPPGNTKRTTSGRL
jgi:hypothetical protein